MRAALDDLVQNGRTNDPTVAAYLRARQVNLAAGGAVIAPWEVHLLEDEWLMAAELLKVELPKYEAIRLKSEQQVTNWRDSHPAMKSIRKHR